MLACAFRIMSAQDQPSTVDCRVCFWATENWQPRKKMFCANKKKSASFFFPPLLIFFATGNFFFLPASGFFARRPARAHAKKNGAHFPLVVLSFSSTRPLRDKLFSFFSRKKWLGGKRQKQTGEQVMFWGNKVCWGKQAFGHRDSVFLLLCSVASSGWSDWRPRVDWGTDRHYDATETVDCISGKD